MSKKNIVLFLAVLFALLWNIPVFAEEKGGGMSESVSVYCSEGKLYTFVRFREDNHPQQLSGTLRFNNISLAESSQTAPVRNTVAKIHYVLLVDRSTSMREHAEEVERFAKELAETEAENAVYSVLTFGNQFEAVSWKLEDAEEMHSIVGHLQYDGTLSDLYGGVEQAVKYLDGHPQSDGEFVNLILVTDGNVYLSSTLDGNQGSEDQKSKSTAELINSSSEFVLHTFCVNEWDTLAGQTFSTGKGLHLHSGSQDASVPAQELAKFVEEVYRLDFVFRPVEGQRLDLKLQLNGRQNGLPFFQEHELSSVPLLQASPDTEPEGSSTAPPPSDGTGGEQEKPPAGKPEGKDPVEGETEKSPAGEAEKNPVEGEKEKPPAGETEENKPSEGETEKPTTGGSEEDEPTEGETEKPGGTESGEKDNEETNAEINKKGTEISTIQWIAIVCVLVVVIVILLIIIAVILLAQKKESKKQNESVPEGSIYMRLDVISGQLVNVEKEFYLHDQLIIGRSRKCDIVWKDKCVSEENSRIYMENQKIYIEDLNSTEGTALGGMRLYAPNILRSGEQISIGIVCFVLHF